MYTFFFCTYSIQIPSIKNIIIVHDDLESILGKAKIKEGGSAEGHNGLKSIINSFKGEKDFLRLKIGIDRPPSKEPEVVASYVLEKFGLEE